MKLSTYAKSLGICYKSAWNYYKNDLIDGAYQLKSGTIIVPDRDLLDKKKKIVLYSRVSSYKQKSDLDRQSDRIYEFSIANGWMVDKIVKEIGSGLNDNRKKLNSILDDANVTKIVVEHKDRLTRFGFNHMNKLLKQRGCEIVVINRNDDSKKELMEDFVSLVTSMVARLYGIRKSKRRTEQLIKEAIEQC